MEITKTIKSGRLRGLLYREWALSKSAYITSLITCAVMTVFGILVLVSFKVGNLAKLPQQYDEVVNMVIPIFFYAIPPFLSSLLLNSPVAADTLDERVMWKRFRCACPVKPWEFAFVKAVIQLVTLAAVIAFGFSYVAIVREINGGALSVTDAAYLMTFYTAAAVLVAYNRVLIMLLHTLDKAMTAMIISIALPCLIWSAIAGSKKVEDAVIIAGLEKFCTAFLPFSPLVIAAAVAVQFAVMTRLIGKGEK